MDTNIKKHQEESIREKQNRAVKLYNPSQPDISKKLRISSIELTDGYTRIDFSYRSPDHYMNGGWISMDAGCYIQPAGTEERYGMIEAIGIPIAPKKHYFNRSGEFFTYTLVFPGLPKSVTKINIIEKEAPGNFFNFYNVDYSRWMNIPHPMDVPVGKN
jgi:hypothetical protein